MNKHLSSAIYKILKPVIRLMFRNNISFGDFATLAKRVYIDVTEMEIITSGQKATTSRIAIITGLTRKDVAALRKETTPKIVSGVQQNRGIRVISGWISEAEFCDAQGQAKPLDLIGKEGSFESLVNKHSGDMPYRAMLNELIRIGAVELKENDKVKLVRAVYVPSDSENGSYDLLGEDASLLLTTIQYNILNKNQEPRYQRKVCYDKIPQEYIGEFKELAYRENQLLLVKLNSWLAQHDMDRQQSLTSNQPMKVGVGVYYFEEKSKPQGL